MGTQGATANGEAGDVGDSYGSLSGENRHTATVLANFVTHCLMCEAPMVQRRRGRPRRFCSGACRVRYHRERWARINQAIQELD